jgi:GR25 family glycosyltransferase involved in LPS biosynthesis
MKNINFNPKIFNFCEAVTPDTLTTLETSQIDLKETRLACWLSHINIWRKYKYENEPILILEDDVRFNKDFQFRLNKILAKLKTIEWDMCFLGRVQIENKCANKSLNTCDLEWIKNGFHQTHCYLINGNSIPKLLNMCELNCIETKRDPKDFAIDVYISDLIKENKIKALGVKKQLAKQVSSDYYGSSTM